ncbi:hypothetical protein TPHV1_160004 [Treponema phagedenis]|uniref:Uncharacterized protein n=1 Tax=Treponema phagedenis TaxID=162 RepID=A0A0B7GRX6_TREPH|nr:hypothetical protein TPHV1_160004 [Treponema phagedenis]
MLNHGRTWSLLILSSMQNQTYLLGTTAQHNFAARGSTECNFGIFSHNNCKAPVDCSHRHAGS